MALSHWFKLLQLTGPPARLCVLHQHKENSSGRWFCGPGVLMSCSLRALPLSLADPSSCSRSWNDFHLLAAGRTRGSGHFANASDPSNPSPCKHLKLALTFYLSCSYIPWIKGNNFLSMAMTLQLGACSLQMPVAGFRKWSVISQCPSGDPAKSPELQHSMTHRGLHGFLQSMTFWDFLSDL